MELVAKLKKSLGFDARAPHDDVVRRALDRVDAQFATLPYMKRDKAVIMLNLIRREGLTRLLELGVYKGKSTAYLAALLDEAGAGSLSSIDRKVVLEHNPNVQEVLKRLGLERHVSMYLDDPSLTWSLRGMLRKEPRPVFDFCYLDAGHSWDVTGFGFLLVDQLLAPGGWLVFDDLDWSIRRSAERRGKADEVAKTMPEELFESCQVREVWELLVKPHPDYEAFSEIGPWGLARKRKELPAAG